MSRAVVGSWDLEFRAGTSFAGQLAVVRVSPPPSGMGTTARHRRASPQGAELTARHITFSWLRCRGARKWLPTLP